MSDTIESDTVEVIVGDGRFRGCGGPEVLPRHIAGSSWDLETVGGEAVPFVGAETPEQRKSLFTIHWQLNSTVHTNLGCGELLGRYRAAQGRIVSTERLAPRPGRCQHDAIQRKALAILSAPVSIRWVDDDEAEIRSSRGVIRLRRRY